MLGNIGYEPGAEDFKAGDFTFQLCESSLHFGAVMGWE
jgi:hypothetical protein